jgi:hypothetical protein
MTNPWIDIAAAPKKGDEVALEPIPLSRKRQDENQLFLFFHVRTLHVTICSETVWASPLQSTAYVVSIIPSHLFDPLSLKRWEWESASLNGWHVGSAKVIS